MEAAEDMDAWDVLGRVDSRPRSPGMILGIVFGLLLLCCSIVITIAIVVVVIVVTAADVVRQRQLPRGGDQAPWQEEQVTAAGSKGKKK